MRLTKRGIQIRTKIRQMRIAELQRQPNMIDKECDDGQLVRPEEDWLGAVLLPGFGVVRKDHLAIVHRRQIAHLQAIDGSDPALRRESVMAGHGEADKFVVCRLQSQIAHR